MKMDYSCNPKLMKYFELKSALYSHVDSVIWNTLLVNKHKTTKTEHQTVNEKD